MTKTKKISETKKFSELDLETKNKIISLYNKTFTKKKFKNIEEEENQFQQKKLFMETLFNKKISDKEFDNNKELSGNYKLTKRKMIMYGALWSN